MKVLDTIKHTKWKGNGFDLQGNNLIILKSASVIQNFEIQKGKYKIKILGKKRAGNGKVTLEILSESNNLFLSQEINFNQSIMTEYSFEFDVNEAVGLGKIKLSRNKDVFGSVEIGRLFIDWDSGNELKLNSQFKEMSKIIKKRVKGIGFSSNHFFNYDDKNLAFIVPYHIYGGAEVYIQNLINEIPSEYQISILYLGENVLQSRISRLGVNHKSFKKLNQLKAYLKSSNFNYIVFYNRAEVYQSLLDMKEKNEITSQIIEIYHSNFSWPGSLSLFKSRKDVYKFITVAPSLGFDILGVEPNIVPVGIDLDLYQPRKNLQLISKLNLDGYKGIIGCVSRLSKEKRIEYIINLAKHMQDYAFVIVGDGPENFALKNLIEEFNINNIRLVGFQKNVFDYYNIFDAFILNSVMEGTPISIIEAMASGVIVFSNMVGAISDLIKDQETGIKISQNLEKDIEIISKNIGRKDIILNARRFVEENHDIKKNTSKFLEFIFSSKITLMDRNEDMIILQGQYI